MQPEDVFAGHLAARAVFEKVRSILEGLGPVEVRTSKSQVAFHRGRGVACLWMPGQKPVSANRGGGLIDRLGPS